MKSNGQRVNSLTESSTRHNGTASLKAVRGNGNGRLNGRTIRVLITGGAGFIGTNVAAALAADGHKVHILDNLSRPGVEQNLRWLMSQFPRRVSFVQADIRDADAVTEAVADCDTIYHFAAQVAVTTSLEHPRPDFAVNAEGTLNVLEACRQRQKPPALLFTSTNKVYGELGGLPLRLRSKRYEPVDQAIQKQGINEHQPLDFHSPYGCSKGTADQYVLDYARCYRLPAMVFRMSCIYGPHQCGTEDQGWVAHFVRQVLRNEPITFYGDGCQVRDLLYVDDLVRAMRLATQNADRLAGQVFNMGGGIANAVSLREVAEIIGELEAAEPEILSGPWRRGDQRYYVTDTARFHEATGWRAAVGVREGIAQLCRWMHGVKSNLVAAV